MKTSEIFKAAYPLIGMNGSEFLCIALGRAYTRGEIMECDLDRGKSLIDKALNGHGTLEGWAETHAKFSYGEYSQEACNEWRRAWCLSIIAEHEAIGG